VADCAVMNLRVLAPRSCFVGLFVGWLVVWLVVGVAKLNYSVL
jgi:hypothetical protein